MTNTQLIKKGLLLLGSFIIAYLFAELLHELGHATAAWITGGTVRGIVVHPFNWSYSMSYCGYPRFHTAAGAGFSSVFAVVLFGVLYRKLKVWLLPLLLIGPVILINNGDYLLVDALFRTGGDSCSLISMGVPPAVIIITSITLLVLGFYLAFLLMRESNFLNTGFGGRLFILMLGIYPYIFASFIWDVIFYRTQMWEDISYSFSAAALTILFAVVPIQKTKNINVVTFKFSQWRGIVITNFIAVGLIVFFLTVPLSYDNALGIEEFSERPEDFPSVMLPPDFAKDISYFRSTVSVKPYFLNYNFSESIPLDQISAYTTDLHKQHGYVLLTHEIDDPNEVLENGWTEETEQINGVPVTTKQCGQCWIKIDSQPMESLVFIVYMWRKDKFHSAYVIHNVIEYSEYDQLYNYAKIHPEQFDPNNIEKIKILSLAEHEIEKTE